MNDFLRKMKLTDSLTVTLPIGQKAFIKKLSAITEKGDFGVFAPTFEVFTDSHKIYKGYIYENTFRIRRKRQIFDQNPHLAYAEGTVIEDGHNIIVEVDISSFNFQLFLLVIVWIFMLSLFFVGLSIGDKSPIYNYLLLGFFGLFSFLIFYMMLRRSVSKLKYELERELFYLSKS
jgi:hypothetical protein